MNRFERATFDTSDYGFLSLKKIIESFSKGTEIVWVPDNKVDEEEFPEVEINRTY